MPTDEITDQSFESIPPQDAYSARVKYLTLGKLKIRIKIILILITGCLGILTFFLILHQPSKPPLSQPPPPLSTPTPTPFEEKISSPSAYATDSAILKIEATLKAIEKELQTIDLKEASLNPPILDMNVKF